MPKSQIVEPAEERKSGSLSFAEIPLNQYQQDIEKEKEAYGGDALVGMYEDMLLIHEFESMLQSIKTQGSYRGSSMTIKEPLTFRSDRRHLQSVRHFSSVWTIISSVHTVRMGKFSPRECLRYRKLDDDSLLEIMKNFLGGDCFRIVEKEDSNSVKDFARNFLLYGALAEIFGRENGFNRGLGGSMHAFSHRLEFYPTMLSLEDPQTLPWEHPCSKVNRKSGIVISSVGDASMGCGPTWEAMNFAAMRQFRELVG